MRHVCRLLVCRLNFTLRHLDVTCEAYDHFRTWLQRLERLSDGRLRFAVEPVEASFPQLLVYERIQQLVGAAPTVCGPLLVCATLLTPGSSRHGPCALVLSGQRSARRRRLQWGLPILRGSLHLLVGVAPTVALDLRTCSFPAGSSGSRGNRAEHRRWLMAQEGSARALGGVLDAGTPGGHVFPGNTPASQTRQA